MTSELSGFQKFIVTVSCDGTQIKAQDLLELKFSQLEAVHINGHTPKGWEFEVYSSSGPDLILPTEEMSSSSTKLYKSKR